MSQASSYVAPRCEWFHRRAQVSLADGFARSVPIGPHGWPAHGHFSWHLFPWACLGPTKLILGPLLQRWRLVQARTPRRQGHANHPTADDRCSADLAQCSRRTCSARSPHALQGWLPSDIPGDGAKSSRVRRQQPDTWETPGRGDLEAPCDAVYTGIRAHAGHAAAEAPVSCPCRGCCASSAIGFRHRRCPPSHLLAMSAKTWEEERQEN